jgi:hypothetical protein
VSNVGYSSRWQAINPGPWLFYHNIEQYSQTQ